MRAARYRGELRLTPVDRRLIYDGDCPFCRWYCRRFEPAVTLVDFRRAGDALNLPGGCDPDRALVLEMGGEHYTGAAALWRLAHAPGRPGGNLNFWLFGSRRLGTLIYPLLRALRNGHRRLAGMRGITGDRR